MANPTSCLTLGLASTPECSQVMALYCSTSDDQDLTYTQKWQGDELTSPCRRFVALNLGNQRQYVPVVDAYVRRYLLTERKAITYASQGSQIYDPAIEDVVKVCSSYVGGCDNTLSAVCSGFTAQELGGNPNQARLCGCFMAPAEYDKSGGVFGVGKECSPTCLLQSAVKPRDPSNQTDFLRCKQSICIIDDVTINILGKSTAGNISFNQACSSCSGGPNSSSSCVCNISDVSITAVESTIKDTSFVQQCGGPSQVRCFKRDINGVPRPIPCDNLDPAKSNNTTTTSLTSSRLRTILIVSIIVIVVIIIIVIVVLLLRRNQPSVYRPASTTVINTPPLAYYPSGYSGSSLSRAPLL